MAKKTQKIGKIIESNFEVAKSELKKAKYILDLDRLPSPNTTFLSMSILGPKVCACLNWVNLFLVNI